MVMERDMTWGGEHTIQGKGDVLWNCAPETCIIFFSQCHPNKFNEKENKKVLTRDLSTFGRLQMQLDLIKVSKR